MEDLLEFFTDFDLEYLAIGLVVLVALAASILVVRRFNKKKEVKDWDSLMEKLEAPEFKEEVKTSIKPQIEKAEVKVEVKAEVKAAGKVSVDYSKMTVAELKAAAKEKGLTGYTSLKKAELVELLKGE